MEPVEIHYIDELRRETKTGCLLGTIPYEPQEIDLEVCRSDRRRGGMHLASPAGRHSVTSWTV